MPPNTLPSRHAAEAVVPDVGSLLAGLRKEYPHATYELNWTTAEELLVATILAAQCTDERVNQVTATLFRKYPSPQAFAEADLQELEQDVKPTGFYRNKARRVQDACRQLVRRFQGRVPRSIDDLTTLPGVARKTANVVLNVAYNEPSGVIVDAHVKRVAPRLGLTRETEPEAIETDLMRIFPRDVWTFVGPALVLHGRRVCTASSPRCGVCVLSELCPKIGVSATSDKSSKSSPSKSSPSPVKSSSSAPSQDDSPMNPSSKANSSKSKAQPAAAQKSFLASDSSSSASSSAGSSSPNLAPAGIHESWRLALAEQFQAPYFQKLQQFVADRRAQGQVFPPADDVYQALRLTPLDQVKVFLLGQDPYHDDGQAHGLCFSVRPGVKPPPSLVNVFKELEADLGIPRPNHGCLESWAKQGVLLLNAVLTVDAHQPNSHKDQGWETFTDAVIRAVNDQPQPVVFVLWGGYARKKVRLIDSARHTIIESAHPSPLSVKSFLGTRPFSKTNAALQASGRGEIDWRLPPL